MTRFRLPDRITLKGLEVAPSQFWGAVRLVPLIRRNAPGDLRLTKRSYKEDAAVVSLGGEVMAPGTAYVSYVPHGLVMTWDEDGTPVAPFGTHLNEGKKGKEDGKVWDCGPFSVRIADRMVKREGRQEDENRLRLLPLHLAMEGFLGLYFNGPEIAWSEYSKQAISRGLGDRVESSLTGRGIIGLEDALRVLEIHENQVGVLLFVSGAMAAVSIVSHPEDYRALHRSLIEDFFGEILFYYGLYGNDSEMFIRMNDAEVRSVSDLRPALGKMRKEWETFQLLMTEDLIGREVKLQRVYRAGPFQLARFITDLDRHKENHIGEVILRADGTVEYMKTFLLSEAQRKRAYLLSRLAEHNWNIDATAASEKQHPTELILRLEKAGFGYLLMQHVLDAAHSRRRRLSKQGKKSR